MKINQRITAILFTLILFITSVTACGKPSNITSNSSSSQDTTAPQDQTYHISWIGAQNSPLCDDPIMIDYWNKLFNVEIDYWNIDSNNWNDILSTKFASGQYPDVLYVNSFSNFSTYTKQNILAAIPQEMLNKYMPNTINKITADYKNLMKICQVNGVQYSIPIGINDINQFREAMCYRGDWMENVGITSIPTTLNEFEDLVYRFTNNDPDRNGINDTYGLSSTGLAMVYGAFGWQRKQWNEVNGKLVYSSIQPEMKQALALLAKWYAAGVIDPEFITGENTSSYWAVSDAFIDGRIGYTGLGAYYHWMPRIGDYNEETKTYSKQQPGVNVSVLAKKDAAAADKIKQAQPVTGPNGKKGGVGFSLPHSHSVGFSAHMADEPDKMAKVMTMYEYWTSSADNWFTARYGIEGEMWHYNEDGVPISDFAQWREKNYNGDVAISLPGIGAHSVLECFVPMEYVSIENKYGYDWAFQNGYDQNILRDQKCESFPSSGKYEDSLSRIEDEAYIAIITGQKPVDYFDTFVSEWKANGGNILTEEANEWWQSTK